MSRKRRLSEVCMEADSPDRDRAADLVVPRIVDMLYASRRKEAAPEVRRVEALEDFLAAVGKAPVAEQKAEATESQILLMGRHDPVRNEGDPGTVVAPMP